jgi:hypothetical protein
MPLLQVLLLAVVSMVGLAMLRLIRVHVGRTPLPDGRGRRVFLIAFVVVPPLAMAAAFQPATAAGPLRGLSSLPAYTLFVTALVIVMAIAAAVIGQVVHSRGGRLARLALAGSQDDPATDIPSVAPITAQLARLVVLVDRANAAFPRGRDFPAQVERTDFRPDWDALDVATRTLERDIASERLLAIGVASHAEATATDARSRLDTLRRIAAQNGQDWARDQLTAGTVLPAR